MQKQPISKLKQLEGFDSFASGEFEFTEEEQSEFEIFDGLANMEDESVENIEAYIESLNVMDLSKPMQHFVNSHVRGLSNQSNVGEFVEKYTQSETYLNWHRQYAGGLVVGNREDGFEKIKAFCALHNELEVVNRKDYYAYLLQREEAEPTFIQHLARFGNLFLFDDTANNLVLQQFEKDYQVELPNELKSFYHEVGKLDGENHLQFHIMSLTELRTGLESNAEWSRLNGLGIVDMLKYAWGNGKDEFSAQSGNLTQAEIDFLNGNYKTIGFIRVDDNVIIAIYYDEYGNFGVVWYNQDDGDVFEYYLDKMLQQSPARYCLAQILSIYLFESSNPYLKFESLRDLTLDLAT